MTSPTVVLAFFVSWWPLSTCGERARPPSAAVGERPERPDEVRFEGRVWRAGDRVQLASRAGTFKPADTGYAIEVVAGPGQVGTLLYGERRQPMPHFTPDPDEPIQIVRVRWDAQSWTPAPQLGAPERPGPPVRLEAFEATVHLSYLRKP